MTCPGLPRAGSRLLKLEPTQPSPSVTLCTTRMLRNQLPRQGLRGPARQRCAARSTRFSPACPRPGAHVGEMGAVSWKCVRRALEGWGRQSPERERNWKWSGRQGGDWTGPEAWPLASSTPGCCLGGGGGGAHPEPIGLRKEPEGAPETCWEDSPLRGPHRCPQQWLCVRGGWERAGPWLWREVAPPLAWCPPGFCASPAPPAPNPQKVPAGPPLGPSSLDGLALLPGFL